MIGCILFSSMRIYASDVRLVNDSIKLDLKFEKSTMLEVLNTLKKKTALNFVYNHEEIRDSTYDEGVPAGDGTPDFGLLFAQHGVCFSVVNDVVVIKRKR